MKHVKCYIPEYPRPQKVRSDWQNLNGTWAFAFGEDVSEKEALTGKLPMSIRVPFSYETELSGINRHEWHETVWYAHTVSAKAGKRAILHIEGADYITTVYVNGALAGKHEGAYSRISLDITSLLTKEENMLVIRCDDDNHPSRVRGKQRWLRESFGCWYVQTTGIYKTVWMEYVNDVYLTDLKITPSIETYSAEFEVSVSQPADDVEVRFAISYEGEKLFTTSVWANEIDNTVTVKLDTSKRSWRVDVWGPDHPCLYDVDITVYKNGDLTDTVGSYFGVRDYRTSGNQILLNSGNFYPRLLLDQGYWPESGVTPPSEEAIIKDIELCKEMGFNGVRKHQKVEDERYFYYADIIGFTVWCELPSNHWFSDSCTQKITDEWLKIVRQNYNHPSLVTWVVFNESWGVLNIANNARQQNLATGLYYLTKSIDPMRPVVSNDGWEHTVSDILTLHHYEQNGERLFRIYQDILCQTEGCSLSGARKPYAKGYSYGGQPIIFSEFGGTAYIADAQNECWGYGVGVRNDEEFLERFGGLIQAIGKMNIAGYCYTQVTDVEHEVNGLLQADRTPKVPLEEIRKRNKV